MAASTLTQADTIFPASPAASQKVGHKPFETGMGASSRVLSKCARGNFDFFGTPAFTAQGRFLPQTG